MKKLSILIIGLSSGGAEKVTSLLLKKLVNDFEVTLILHYNRIHFEIPDKVKVIILSNSPDTKNLSFFRQLTDSLKFTGKYLKILKSNEIEIAISLLALPNFINSIASIRFPKLKTIISERGYPSTNTTSKLSHFISKIFYPILYNRNSKLFSNSEYINKDLIENFHIKIPMEVIYNPIEIPDVKIVPEQLVSLQENLKIVTVGTLNERKNQKMIIEAIASMNLNFKLDIYGDGPLKNNLISLINQRGLSKEVRLKGTVANVYEHLLNYNCFVLSSYTEGFPNALLEAMAIGLPCISTNCLSGPLELLNGSNAEIEIEEGNFYRGKYGLLINNNDSEALSKALLYFNEEIEERIEYGKLASEKASEFELNVVYKQFKSFITS